MAAPESAQSIPQASLTGFSSRLKLGQTSLIISAQPVASRSSKRAATSFSYADYDDLDDEYDEGNSSALATPRAEVKEKETKKPAQPLQHPIYSKAELKRLAEEEELLVPIRLNLDLDNGQRLCDFFMWNLNEVEMTPEVYAKMLCADLDLPQHYSSMVSNAIRSQITDHRGMATLFFPEDANIKVVVNLSVNLDKQLYEDKFEWDLATSNDTFTPEEFAKTVVQDMGLTGEFYPAIAHALHEIILKLKREVVEGQAAEFDNLNTKQAGWRLDHDGLGDEWCPTVERLSAEEIERREVERERAIRRAKRESARMGEDMRRFTTKRFRYDSSPTRGGSPMY